MSGSGGVKAEELPSGEASVGRAWNCSVESHLESNRGGVQACSLRDATSEAARLSMPLLQQGLKKANRNVKPGHKNCI